MREPWVTPGGLKFARDLAVLAEALGDNASAAVFKVLVADLERVQGSALAENYGEDAQRPRNSGSRSVPLSDSSSQARFDTPLSTPQPAWPAAEPVVDHDRRCYDCPDCLLCTSDDAVGCIHDDRLHLRLGRRA